MNIKRAVRKYKFKDWIRGPMDIEDVPYVSQLLAYLALAFFFLFMGCLGLSMLAMIVSLGVRILGLQ
jgi:hypothetical protein